jgi:hypothetical protein
VSNSISSSALFDSIGSGDASWRQYVPLVVSTLVIVDILLGSPVANRFASLLRPPPDALQNSDNDAPTTNDDSRSLWNFSFGQNDRPTQQSTSSKERIDSLQVAKQAIDKAQNTLELRRYLESRKTDQDRIEEVKRKLESQYKEVDESLSNL